jgi:hypothetical protein
VTNACVTAIQNATCDDITESGSRLEETCFPRCHDQAPNTTVCESDESALRICNDGGRLLVADCAKACSVEGKKFMGGCGEACPTAHSQPGCCCA